MQKEIKYMIIGAIVVVALIAGGFYAVKVYNAAVAEATLKIKAGVTEGVQDGIGKGIGGALNPLKLPGKIFGVGK